MVVLSVKKRGRLIVKNADGSTSLFSGKWLYEQGIAYSSAVSSGSDLLSNPRESLERHAPSLFEKDLLRPQDFRNKKAKRASDLIRPTKSGYVSIDGIRYSMGRALAGKSVRVRRVTDEMGVIIEVGDNGQETIHSTFHWVEKGDPRLKERKTNSGSYFEAGAAVVGREAFTGSLPKENEESLDAYKERVHQFENLQLQTLFKNQLRQDGVETDLLDGDLSFLSDSGDTLRKYKDSMADLIRDMGSVGIDLIRALSDLPRLAAEAQEALARLPKKDRDLVASQIVNAATARKEAITFLDQRTEAGDIDRAQARRIRFDLGARIGRVIEVMREQVVSADLRAGDMDLSAIQSEVDTSAVFSGLFRDAFKGEGPVDFSELRGVELSAQPASALSKSEQEAIRQIFLENWKNHDPGAQKVFLQGLEDRFVHGKTQFFILKRENKIVSYIGFDDRPDLGPNAVWGGVFNVDPSYRGSGIGGAMMDQALDQVAQDHVVYAQVYPWSDVGTYYVEQQGLVISGVSEVGGDSVMLDIKRDDSIHDRYRAWQEGVTREKLQEGLLGVRLEQYVLPKDKERMLQDIRKASQNNEVGTRYWSEGEKRWIAFEQDIQENEVSLDRVG